MKVFLFCSVFSKEEDELSVKDEVSVLVEDEVPVSVEGEVSALVNGEETVIVKERFVSVERLASVDQEEAEEVWFAFGGLGIIGTFFFAPRFLLRASEEDSAASLYSRLSEEEDSKESTSSGPFSRDSDELSSLSDRLKVDKSTHFDHRNEALTLPWNATIMVRVNMASICFEFMLRDGPWGGFLVRPGLLVGQYVKQQIGFCKFIICKILRSCYNH